MTDHDRQTLVEMDQQFVWHPFTPHSVYSDEAPLMVVRGEGNYLIDADGSRYLDGVSSIWCNVFGHRKAEIDDAIAKQLTQIAHSTFLGNASAPGVELAAELVRVTPESLRRVFYSDSGSTAVEVALKIALQYWQQVPIEGGKKRTRFVTLRDAYHGDTVGSVSLGGMELFHARYGSLLFETIEIPSPYCSRCPLGLERSTCETACIKEAVDIIQQHGDEIAGLFIEPAVQGAAGMIVQPEGYLLQVCEAVREAGGLVIFDEVAVGFGRSGKSLFACEIEGFVPDILCLAKGLTGGYLPLAATLTTEGIFEAFLGRPEEGKTFYHGHTYTGNALASAAALATLELMNAPDFLPGLREREAWFGEAIQRLSDNPWVGDIRRWGLMAGVELVKDQKTGQAFESAERIGAKVCIAARQYGVFLRPLGDTLIFVPPLSIEKEEIDLLVDAAHKSILDVLGAQ